MEFTSTISEENQKAVLHNLVGNALVEHPLPWRIYQDWSHEVRDSRGEVVTKCHSKELAGTVIQLATEFDIRTKLVMDEVDSEI